MSMHIEKAYLTTTGTKKGKKKFASSAAKQQAALLEQEWQQKQKEWDKLSPKFAKSPVKLNTTTKVAPKTEEKIPSLNSWVTGPVASKQIPKYTGTEILGIAVQHKSCLQPIFNSDAAKDSASMRR